MALEVFKIVVPAVVGYIQSTDKDVVTFSAAGSERRRPDGSVINTRQAFYDRLLKTVISVLPDYFAVSEEKGPNKYYVVGKIALRDEIMSRMKKKSMRNQREDEPLRFPLENPVEIEPEIDPRWWDEESWEDEEDDSLGPPQVRPSPFRNRKRLGT